MISVSQNLLPVVRGNFIRYRINAVDFRYLYKNCVCHALKTSVQKIDTLHWARKRRFISSLENPDTQPLN